MITFTVEQDTWEYMLHFMYGVWSRSITRENPHFLILEKAHEKLSENNDD